MSGPHHHQGDHVRYRLHLTQEDVKLFSSRKRYHSVGTECSEFLSVCY